MSEIKVNKNQYDAEYLKGCAESSKRSDALYGNGDGKLTAAEFQADFMNLNNSVFANDEGYKSYANDLVNGCTDLFQKYAGSDGVIDASEMANLINSDEYDKFITEWRRMSDAMDEGNKNSQSYLNNVDMHGDGDGVTSTDEYLQYKLDLYENIFKENQDLASQAKEIAYKEYENMKKFAGSDGVIDVKDYIAEMSSDASNQLNKQYWNLRDQQDVRSVKNDPIRNAYQIIIDIFKSMLGLD